MSDTVTCVSCGAANTPDRVSCWLCFRPIALGQTATPAPITAAVGQVPRFGLSSMMLVIALVAVCLGLIREAPGLGIGLAIAVTPALLRTTVVVSRKKTQGRVPSMAEKVVVFLGSLGVVVTVAVAAGVAFYATCWAGFLGGATVSSAWGATGYEPLGLGLWTGVILGILVGIFVLVWVGRRLWPYKG